MVGHGWVRLGATPWIPTWRTELDTTAAWTRCVATAGRVPDMFVGRTFPIEDF